MVRFIMLSLTWAFTLTSTVALAHADSQHVLGTVTVIDATHVEVKTPKGKTVGVQLNKQSLAELLGHGEGRRL